MQTPEISIIIASRNHAEFLGRCLRSIFAQRQAPKFEVVIFDDGSTDETPAILRAFHEDIVYLRSEVNIGLPAALNRAISKAQGQYIVRVDSDDYISEHFLQVLYLAITRNDNCKAVACDYLEFGENLNAIVNKNCAEEPIACGILFDRAVFTEIGPYNEDFLANEEREFRQRFEKKYKVLRVAIPLYRYRRHASNMTNDTALMEKYNLKLFERGEG